MNKDDDKKGQEHGPSKFKKDSKLNMDLKDPIIKNLQAETISIATAAIGTPKSN